MGSIKYNMFPATPTPRLVYPFSRPEWPLRLDLTAGTQTTSSSSTTWAVRNLERWLKTSEEEETEVLQLKFSGAQ